MKAELVKKSSICKRMFTRPSRMTRSDFAALVTCRDGECLREVKSANGALGSAASRKKARASMPAPVIDRTWTPLADYVWREPRISWLFSR